MPWGKLISEVLLIVSQKAPKNGSVLDLMCGPGYFLGKINNCRNDLKLTGVDIDKRYIQYAKRKYKGIEFIQHDVLTWNSKKKFEVILCTGGLHHIPYTEQEDLIKKIGRLLVPGGFCILADPYVAKYKTEKERRLAAAQLGVEYLKAVLEKNASDELVSATIDIMHNDVLPNGEYKTYISRIKKIVRKYFKQVTIKKVWPKHNSEFGDYFLILNNN